MNRLIAIITFLIPTLGFAQNLVPNPSFEENDTCPYGLGNMSMLHNWVSVYGGTYYFHECGTNGSGIPVSEVGGGYARTGQAYIGLSFWYSLGAESNYCGVDLLEPLIAGKKYKVVYYISLMDSVWYGIKNISVYFSQDQPPANVSALLTYEPQIKYTGTDFLNDKYGWTKIEGSFYADGGEQFMTIGNFDGHNNTDTMFVPDGGVPPSNLPDYYKISAYFIDDVWVILDTTTGINELESISFEVYPNPAKETITVQTEINKNTTLQLLDITGRVVFTTSLSAATTSVDIAMLPAGVYTGVLLQNGAVAGRKKIIIQ